MRVVIHNHVRPIGKFRATARAHDHGPGCHCGGGCDSCKDKLRLRHRDSDYERANLSIDVRYSKGRDTTMRHYVVPGFQVDQRGGGPQPAGVTSELRRLPEHASMLRSGWVVDKAEGYYKQKMSDLNRKEL
jgi:hypothetical protein